MALCPAHHPKVALGQGDWLFPGFELQPAGALSDDVKHCPISFKADTPWRAELTPVSDATLRPDASKHVLKQRPTRRLDCGGARRFRRRFQAIRDIRVFHI